MSTVAEYRVDGVPQPQGSVRAFNRKGGGRPIVTADNPKTRPWKDAVRDVTIDVWRDRDPLAGPVAVHLMFTFPRLKGHYRKGVLRLDAPELMAVRPDVDKLCRAVLDALDEAEVFGDDGQVARLTATKAYGEDAGVIIRVEQPGW